MKGTSAFVASLVVITAAASRAQTVVSRDAGIVKELEAELARLADEDEFSGVVLLAKGSTPISRVAYGWADKAAGIKNDVETRFNLGSINKSFTSVAIAQLAQAGKLSFTDTVGKHLPDYPNRAVAENVTLHHLLTHSSGMGDYFNERFQARRASLKTLTDLLPLFVDEPLAFEPGEKMRYSNAGYVVLGLIIEKLTGQSYYSYVKEHIFNPAGMENTDSFERDGSAPKLATGYTRSGADGSRSSTGPRESNEARLPARGSSAGGGYSTVDDLLRFAHALQEHRLLNPTFTEIVFTAGRSQQSEAGSGSRGGGGYGFMVGPAPVGRAVGNGGGGDGVNAMFRMYPDLGYTVVVLSNYDPPTAEKVAGKLKEMISAK